MGFIEEKDIIFESKGGFIDPGDVVYQSPDPDMPKEEWATSEDSLPSEYYSARRKQVAGQVLGTIGEGFKKGGEMAASVTMPFLTWPMGKIAGLYGMVRGENPREYEQAIHEVYDPRPSEEVVTALQPVNKLMEGITYPARKLGEGIQYVTGSPAAGWTAETIGELLTFGYLPKGFKKIGDKVISPKGKVYRIQETTKELGRIREPGETISGGETRQTGRPPFREEPLGLGDTGGSSGRFISPEDVTYGEPRPSPMETTPSKTIFQAEPFIPDTIPGTRQTNTFSLREQARMRELMGEGKGEIIPAEEVVGVSEPQQRNIPINREVPYTEQPQPRITGRGGPGTVEDVSVPTVQEQGYRPGKIAEPEPTPSMGKTEAKEAWEMTKDEVLAREKKIYGDLDHITKKGVVWPDGKFTPFIDKKGNQKILALYEHEKSIKQALSEGKPVPPSVLAEYPELKAKGEKQVYQARGPEDAQKMRQEEPDGSLANYGQREQKEWLRGQTPPQDGKLTLYRATQTGAKIKPGDYVTNNPQYAKDHIINNLGGKGKVAKIEATLDDIYPADGPGEFWYAPKESPPSEVVKEAVSVAKEQGIPLKEPIISAMSKVEPQAKGAGVGEGRKVGEIIKDIGTVINEKAGLTVQDVSKAKEVKQAKERLSTDIDKLKLLAESEMKDLGTYLKEQGYSDMEIMAMASVKTMPDPVRYEKKEGRTVISEESISNSLNNLKDKKGTVNLETDIIKASDAAKLVSESALRQGVKVNDFKSYIDKWTNDPKNMALLYPDKSAPWEVTKRRPENRAVKNIGTDDRLSTLTQLKIDHPKEYDALSKMFWDHDAKKLHNLTDSQLKETGLTDRQIAAYQAKQSFLKEMIGEYYDLQKEIRLFPYENNPFFKDLIKAVQDGELPKDSSIELTNAFDAITKELTPIREHLGELGSVPSYMPRVRKQGNYKVNVADADGNQVHMEKALLSGNEFAVWGATRLKKKLEKQYPGHKVTIERSSATPESVYQNLNIHDLQFMLDTVIDNIKNGKDPDLSLLIDDVKNSMEIGIANELKSRGWGRHAIARKQGATIAGYETGDALSALRQLGYGFNGYTTKVRAAMEYARAMREVGTDNPAVYDFWSEHIRSMMKNDTVIDRAGAMARTGAFSYFLLGNLKQMPLQITQNYTMAIPEFRKIAKNAGVKWHKSAIDIARGEYSNLERKMLQEAKDKNIISDPWAKEQTAKSEGVLPYSVKKIMEIASLPISGMEIFNRTASMLTSFREFTKQGLPYTEAFNKARDFTIKVNHYYGKENLPLAVMKTGPAGRVAYTFGAYPHQYGLWLLRNLGEKRFGTVAESLAALSLAGGVMSIPFVDDVVDLSEKITGTPYRRNMQGAFKELGGTGDVLNWGVGGLVGPGFTLQGSTKTGIPFYGIISGKEDPFENIFSVTGGITKKIKKGAILTTQGDYQRAIEEGSPTAITNFMAGIRGYQSPLTTWEGKQLYDYGNPEEVTPLQYTKTEAGIKMMGLLPARQAQSWAIQSSKNNMNKYYQGKLDSIATKYTKALRNDDQEAIDKIIEEAQRVQNNISSRGIPLDVSVELKKRISGKMNPSKKQYQFQQGLE